MPLLSASKLFISLGVSLLSYLVVSSALFDPLDHFFYDQYHELKPSRVFSKKIVLVVVDESSLEEVNKQWPWPRSIHGKLVRELFKAGAKHVGFDILFGEPSTLEEDSEFVSALDENPAVTLVSHIHREDIGGMTATRVVEPSPLRELALNEISLGYDNVLVDSDGVIRRVIMEQAGKYYFPFSIAREFGVNRKLSDNVVLINYAGTEVPTLPYWQVLEGLYDEDFFQDAIVLVGFKLTSQSLSNDLTTDYFQTPLDRMAGVEVHANSLSNILERNYYKLTDNTLFVGLGVIFGFVYSWALLSMRAGTSFLFGLILLSVVIVVPYLVLLNSLTYYSPVALIVPVIFASLIAPSYQYFLSQKQRTYLREAFSTYLAPEVVSELIKSPESLQLGGELKTGSVAFIDVAGFTSLSEQVSPQELVEVMNAALGRFSEIIMDHNGMVDKFIGDCVMAVWGVPLPNENHASDAVAAMVDIRQAIQEVGEIHFSPLGIELNARMGVSSGEMVAGNVGGKKRFNYTVLGNEVNLASRLEGANKLYDTDILVSEGTYQLLKEKSQLRCLDRISVKGMEKGVEVFTYLRGHESPELLRDYQHAFSEYSVGNFKDAESILKHYLSDPPAKVIYQRCVEVRRGTLEVHDWNGIFNLTEK